MNPLAAAYLKRQHDRLQSREIRRLAVEIKEKQAKLAPMQKRYRDNLWKNRRMDGPTGFVMVRPVGK